MKKLLIVFLFLFSSLNVFAEQLVTFPPKIQRIIKNNTSCSGKFRQRKTLAGLGVTLNSSGVFSVREGKELIWNVLEPMPVRYYITPTLLSMNIGGAEQKQSLVGNRDAAEISAVINSVLSGDYSRIFRDFKVMYEDGAIWKMRLLPLDKNIAAVLRLVDLQGNNESITDAQIEYHNGDVIRVMVER